jgi:Ser/Thr protein kinase RdoA (MazF antagonist)
MKEILKQFAIDNEVNEPQPLKIGFINDSFIIRAKKAGEKSYFLQRINHHIFTNIEGLQQNILKVTNHIRRKLEEAGETDIDRKVLQLVPTRAGQLYYKTPEGDYWRVYVLIEGTQSQEKVTPESAELTGQAFGRFQCQLSDLPFDELCESIPNFHNMEYRLWQLDEALKADAAGRKAACADINIIAEIDKRREEMCQAERLFREGKLPKHINHCDTKVNNVLFDEAGKPICIVDLDTVMPGYVLSDFGDFMRTAANTGAEDDPNLDNIHVDLQVFEAYARGYLKEATFLTELEKELLPFGCRLLSYMQTVRFFTDYINGDTYYKIQYPEHNLVRTKAQLRLVEEQEKVAEQMRSIINSLTH